MSSKCEMSMPSGESCEECNDEDFDDLEDESSGGELGNGGLMMPASADIMAFGREEVRFIVVIVNS